MKCCGPICYGMASDMLWCDVSRYVVIGNIRYVMYWYDMQYVMK